MTVDHAYQCDNVFEILTSGPFPRGDEADASVERHIASCHECRQLAEALRPATELISESLREADTTQLPCYQGYADAPWNVGDDSNGQEHDQVNRSQSRVATDVARVGRRDGFVRINLQYWPFLVAAALFGIGLSMGLEWQHRSNGSETSVSQLSNLHGHPSPEGVPDLQGRQFLVSLELPSDCYAVADNKGAVAEGKQSVADGNETQIADCCTECHTVGARGHQMNAGADSAHRKYLLGRLIGSCGACHISS